jgi:3-oxoacyl-[acyl-carrier protein] reductase
MEIKGSVVLVTGGGNGIGEQVVKYFAKQGARVAVVDMVQKNIDRVVAELKIASDKLIEALVAAGVLR